MKKQDSYFVITLILLLGTGLLVKRIEAGVPVELKKPLESLPLEHGSLYGREAFDMEKNYEAPSADSSLYRTYAESGIPQSVQVYVGYWEEQNKKKKIKLPRYVFDGWGYYRMREKRIASPEWGEVTFNEFLNESGKRRELVYYSFIVNGSVLNNEYMLRLTNMWNAMLHRRNNAAVIRISSFLADDETVEQAENRLEGFLSSFTPVLMHHMDG
ncbi:exosortase C-terminal domain/associated protein EpsI [Candidatus Moduliflexota bacterium]